MDQVSVYVIFKYGKRCFMKSFTDEYGIRALDAALQFKSELFKRPNVTRVEFRFNPVVDRNVQHS